MSRYKRKKPLTKRQKDERERAKKEREEQSLKADPGPGSDEVKIGPCPTEAEQTHAQKLVKEWARLYKLSAAEPEGLAALLKSLALALSVRFVRLEEAGVAQLRRQVRSSEYVRAAKDIDSKWREKCAKHCVYKKTVEAQQAAAARTRELRPLCGPIVPLQHPEVNA